MSARIDNYSLKNQSQDPYFAIAPQTMAEIRNPQKSVHWDRVAIVAAIGLAGVAMVIAYLLSRGMFVEPQSICETTPILLSKACPEAMTVLQNSCALNQCLNLTDCENWKIGQIAWFSTRLICPVEAGCDQLLGSTRNISSMFVEHSQYCIQKSIAYSCPEVINYLQTACSQVINYDVREICKIAANSTSTIHGIVKKCICDINCEGMMTEARSLISSYVIYGLKQNLLTPG